MNRVQKILLSFVGVAAAFGIVTVAAGFLWSGMSVHSTYDMGPVEQFMYGSVTSVTPMSVEGDPLYGYTRSSDGRGGVPVQVHVVRLSGGEFMAFLSTSTHFGCQVEWRSDQVFDGVTGVFLDICFSSRWAIDGTRLFGPAPRDLDQVEVRIEQGRVILHLDRTMQGTDRRSRPGSGTPTPAATPVATVPVS